MLKDDILKELIENNEAAISGQALADMFGVSRNAVWKAVNALKSEGYEIDSVTNRGYTLINDNDILSIHGIKGVLKERYKKMPVVVYESIDSTNNEAKRRIAGDEDLSHMLIVSNEQEAGRGRYGKGFYSPCGGAYFSLIFRLKGAAVRAEIITTKAAVAVIRALKALTGTDDFKIRGINDIYYNEKKVGGILSEAVSNLETGELVHIVCGIGINVSTQVFPEEIKEKAGSLSAFSIKRNTLIGCVVNELMPLYENINDTSYYKEYEAHKI